MPDLQTLDEIKERLKEYGDVLSVSMGDLRKAAGAGRLGHNVVRRIENELSGMGIGHYPDLTTDQWAVVRLFKLGTPMASLIKAVLTPGEEEDAQLRETLSAQAEEIVAKIRELVHP